MLSGLWDNAKRSHIQVIGIPEWDDSEDVTKIYLKK